VLHLEEFTPRRPSRRKVSVRVTHASVGSTDAMARTGDYLLQPRPGFVPGYDFVGVLETVDAAATRRGLRPGTRVAGCLARMGGYTTQLDVASACLVPLPDALDSAQAAALPLDLVTAALAADLAHPPSGGTVFVQGVSGAVGALITQSAVANGMRVIGTASDRTRDFAESLAHAWWIIGIRPEPQRVRDLVPAAPTRASTHRRPTGANGDRSHRHGGAPAWSGRSGHGRMDAALGGFAANIRRYARPRERLCSVPLVVALQPGKYRKLLHDQLNRIVDGRLRGPTVTTIPFADVVDAHRGLATLAPGHKLVLEMDPE
jgi:hypothetical protein